MSFHQKRKNIETISVKMSNCQSIQKCPDFKDSFMIYLHFFLAYLTLKAPIATKVVCLSRLPKCLRSIYGRKCGPRPDCSLFWVNVVCFYTWFVSNVRQLYEADDFSRRHFQISDAFFLAVCLYVLCGHLLGKGWPLGSRLWCLLWVCHFPICILDQVWYLIVSIPDLCTLTYFKYCNALAMMWC